MTPRAFPGTVLSGIIISDEQAAQWATNEAKIDREWLLNVRTTFLAS